VRTVIFCISAGILTAGVSFAQHTDTRPQFEVASVKTAVGVQGIAIKPRRSGNRISYVTTLEMILYYAYHVQPFQVSGDLLDGIYDIQAIMDGTPGEDQIRLMFQALLTDRFRLRLHHETKVMRVYALVVAKKGSKLRAEDASQLMLDGNPVPVGVGTYLSSTGPRLIGKGASIGQLADALARMLQGPVTDRTGLAGAFAFDVHFAKDSPQAAGAETTDVGHLPSLETAIQEQLGLKLESERGPVEILVIDHVEKPSENR
jgi:uncharacterized protein (TIGR03435 family)